MFNKLKEWLFGKSETEVKAPVAKRPVTPPPAPPTRSVRGDRRPPEPPPAPVMRIQKGRETGVQTNNEYYMGAGHSMLYDPLQTMDYVERRDAPNVDVTDEFKITPEVRQYEAPAARQEPVRSPEPYFVEPDRSYESSRDCGSSYDSSSSSDSCSSSFD
jgi:hypothetical protein